MRKRLLGASTALTLALTFGAFGLTGVALAGEDNTTPPPADPVITTQTVTVPVPGPTQTVTVPSPTKTVTVKVKAPAPKHASAGSESSGSSESSSHSTPTANVAATTPTTSTSDTGTVPQGGVQAGAGGTASQGPSPVLMASALGLALLGVASGGAALRRRFSER
jgi:hypothetical protein